MNQINNQKPTNDNWGSDFSSAKEATVPINNSTKNNTTIPINPINEPIQADIPQPLITDTETASLPNFETIQPPKKKSILWEIVEAIGVFIGIFVFIYLFLTFPAQYERIKYLVKNIGQNKEPEVIEIPSNVTYDESDLLLSSLKTALDTEKPEIKQSQQPATKKYSISIADLENNTLIIPKIDVKAPIVWNSPPDEDVMLENLQKGVVHYNGTGLPNQSDGNVFISGHSSYYWWDKGQYKTVFANLGNLENGDEIALAYENKVYIYKVTDKKEVDPSQVEVLQSVGKPVLSLMTCVPVGTNLRRLIVTAERIETDAKNATESSPASTPSPVVTATSTSPTPKDTKTQNQYLDILNLLPWRW